MVAPIQRNCANIDPLAEQAKRGGGAHSCDRHSHVSVSTPFIIDMAKDRELRI
jgi:hypothetical protein